MVIVPRLIAADADLSRVHIPRHPRLATGSGCRSCPMIWAGSSR